MVLRINTNISSMRSARNLGNTDHKLAESLQRLSTGFKINRASDDPSGLVFSEQMRGQIVSVNQAIANSELAASMVQTSEAALTEVNNILIHMRQMALQARNQHVNSPGELASLQAELRDALDAMGLISRNTRFGGQSLLDGSGGVTGEAVGDGLYFVGASTKTRTSPAKGYVVDIEQVPTRSFMQGETEIDEDSLPGLEIVLMEGGRTAKVTALPGDSPRSFYGKLVDEVDRVGLALDLSIDSDNVLRITHQEYGSGRTFMGSSTVDGVLTDRTTGEQILGFFAPELYPSEAARMLPAEPGADIVGSINGERAVGRGQLLTGVVGNPNTEGLVLRYAGPKEEVDEDSVGRPIFRRMPREGEAGVVNVLNQALGFQVGAVPEDQVRVSLPRTAPQHLGRSVHTESDYRSLAEIKINSPARARDALRVIDASLDELTLMRGTLGSVVRNSLNSNIANLRVTAENLMAAESTVRDADLAEELAKVTRDRIVLDTATAAMAHANQIPHSVIRLLR